MGRWEEEGGRGGGGGGAKPGVVLGASSLKTPVYFHFTGFYSRVGGNLRSTECIKDR